MFLLRPADNDSVIAYSLDKALIEGLVEGFCTAFNSYMALEKKKGEDLSRPANHPKKYNECMDAYFPTREQAAYIGSYEARWEKKWLKANPQYLAFRDLTSPILKLYPHDRYLDASDFHIEELPSYKHIQDLPSDFSSHPSQAVFDTVFQKGSSK